AGAGATAAAGGAESAAALTSFCSEGAQAAVSSRVERTARRFMGGFLRVGVPLDYTGLTDDVTRWKKKGIRVYDTDPRTRGTESGGIERKGRGNPVGIDDIGAVRQIFNRQWQGQLERLVGQQRGAHRPR